MPAVQMAVHLPSADVAKRCWGGRAMAHPIDRLRSTLSLRIDGMPPSVVSHRPTPTRCEVSPHVGVEQKNDEPRQARAVLQRNQLGNEQSREPDGYQPFAPSLSHQEENGLQRGDGKIEPCEHRPPTYYTR